MIGYIDEKGIYRRGERKHQIDGVSSQYKAWSHMEQRKRFQKEIVQPYYHGKPNREFIESYPAEQVRQFFSEDQIRETERRLNE